MPSTAFNPIFLLVAGPAGSGKTTLCERLVATHSGVERVITATTRPKRPGEIDGVHYFFLSEAEFDERLARGQFLEWAVVHGRYRYGTLQQAVRDRLSAGVNLVMNIDVQGVRSLQQVAKNDLLLRRALVTVFVAPTAPEELRTRLRKRGDDPDEIARRMQTAESELREAHAFDYVVISRTREEDFAAFQAIWETVQQRAIAASNG